MSLTAWAMLALIALPTANAAPTQVVLESELSWTPLNPARGDASPQAATLWGDRAAAGPSGFLVTFADGFSSPPHIHNVSYRAVVIRGEVHNDDELAKPMWMAPGSYWTQPKGESHITSSQGVSVAYVEIDEGPYLVHPADQAHTVAEKPINVDASNVVWGESSVKGAHVALLWGQPQDGRGSAFVRLQGGTSATLKGADLSAIVVDGTTKVGKAAAGPGSLLSGDALALSCEATCMVYVRTTSGLEVTK